MWLEYVAIILGVVGAILAWEDLFFPTPIYPTVLQDTDNMTASSWTKMTCRYEDSSSARAYQVFCHLLSSRPLGLVFTPSILPAMTPTPLIFPSQLCDQPNRSPFDVMQVGPGQGPIYFIFSRRGTPTYCLWLMHPPILWWHVNLFGILSQEHDDRRVSPRRGDIYTKAPERSNGSSGFTISRSAC
jgi:hypothetical protein